MKVLTMSVVLMSLAANPALADEKSDAKHVFAEYQALERKFDPAVADLYCDTALVRNVRVYPDGTKRAMELPARKYKDLIRAAMPAAKARGDYSTYSDATYTAEGKRVRILATRHSVLKKYSSPISLLVGKCANGRNGLLEEISQSQP